MTSLLDIGPLTREQDIRGVKITVYPIGAQSLFHLITVFPAVKGLMEAQGGAFTANDLLNLGPEIVGYVLAIGTTNREEFDTHANWVKQVHAVAAKAKGMGVGDQLPLINHIFDLTFGEVGAAPFLDQIQTFAKRMGVTDEMLQRFKTQMASSTTTTAPSGTLMNGRTPAKVSGITSPRPLSAALQMDITPGKRMRGRIHPESSTPS